MRVLPCHNTERVWNHGARDVVFYHCDWLHGWDDGFGGLAIHNSGFMWLSQLLCRDWISTAGADEGTPDRQRHL